MTLRLAAAYAKIAAEQGCLLSPVGTAFYDVNTNHPEVVRDTPRDNLPSHPVLAGYLAALCHFAVLYGVSPLSVPYTPAWRGTRRSRDSQTGGGARSLRPVHRTGRIQIVKKQPEYKHQTRIPKPVRRHIRDARLNIHH